MQPRRSGKNFPRHLKNVHLKADGNVSRCTCCRNHPRNESGSVRHVQFDFYLPLSTTLLAHVTACYRHGRNFNTARLRRWAACEATRMHKWNDLDHTDERHSWSYSSIWIPGPLPRSPRKRRTADSQKTPRALTARSPKPPERVYYISRVCRHSAGILSMDVITTGTSIFILGHLCMPEYTPSYPLLYLNSMKYLPDAPYHPSELYYSGPSSIRPYR